MNPTPPRSSPSLGDKLKLLFATVRDPDGNLYTQSAVARFVAARTGLKFHRNYVHELLNDTKNNPTRAVLTALAEFFNVSPSYFFDDAAARNIHEQLELARALRDGGVREVAMRALMQVRPEDLPRLTELIKTLDGQPDTE